MESSESTVEIMKPFLVKAGISMAITLAAFFLTRNTTRKSPVPDDLSSSKNQADFKEDNSCELYGDEEDHKRIDSKSFEIDNISTKATIESSEHILRVKSRMEEIQKREKQVEKHFLYYQDLKDREMAVTEIHKNLCSEINQVEFWEKQILMVEAENQRFEKLVLEFLKFLGIEKENERVKKFLRRKRALKSRILRKKMQQIKEKNEWELEMEMETVCIKKMEGEIKELKMITEQLRHEIIYLLDKLKLSEKSNPTSKEKEEEDANVEKYNQLASVSEQLQQEEADEEKELVYLRSLKQEVMMKDEEEKNKQLLLSSGEIQEQIGSDHNQIFLAQNHSCLGLNTRAGSQAHHSERRKIFKKFKRWVGIEKNWSFGKKDQKHDQRQYFPRNSSVHALNLY